MINITVYSNHTVDIDSKSYSIVGTESMAEFLKDLLDKIWYSGERVCLETATIDSEKGKAVFVEILRYSGYPKSLPE